MIAGNILTYSSHEENNEFFMRMFPGNKFLAPFA